MNDANFQQSPRGKPRRLYLPGETRRLGKSLLTQQCWCWGQDVRRPEGNLLLEFGFERRRPPHGESGATAYLLRLLPNCVVTLWGFGMWYGECDRGAIFVGRFDFEPKLSLCAEPPLPIWTPKQLSALPVPRTSIERRLTRELLTDALCWAADYERWAIEKTGLPYRKRCLEAWSQRFLPPENVVESWALVAQNVSPRRGATISRGAATSSWNNAQAIQ